MRKIIFLLFWFYIGAISIVRGQTLEVDSVFNPKTYNNSYVSDADKYLDSVTIITLNELCYSIDTALNVQIAVVVLKNIGKKDPLELATEIGNTWGVGKDDRGLVVLVAIQNRSMAIATGEGIEPQLSDWRTSKIRRDLIAPKFKLNLFGLGLLDGVKGIRDEIIKSQDLAIRLEKEDLEYERKNQRLIDRYSKVRIYFLFVVGVLLTFISHCYFKWFYKWSFLQLVLISLFVGCLFALLHFPLIQEEDERRVLKNSIGAIVILGLLPLFGVSYYQVYTKRKINESVYVGVLWLFTIVVLWFLYYISFDYITVANSKISLVYWTERPWLIGFAIVALLSLVYTLIMLRIHSNSDPYIRYQRVVKLPDVQIIGLSILLPFPFLTLQMYKEKYAIKYRDQKRYSKSTGLLMQRAGNAYEDQFLNNLQEAEEKAKSVDHDVWFSEQEGDVLVLEYKINSYRKGKCKKCGEKTIKQVLSKMIKSASESESGEMEVRILCCNCNYEEFVNTKIPRIHVSSFSSSYTGSSSSSSYSSSSSSYSSSRSSSSSSSSSSGGSWGGGSFGGGGSKGSW
jgi:uncharacterized protein